jgi:undecaprenyl-diphosphatase
MTASQHMLQFIASRDHKLMRKVNKWRAPKWVRLSAMAATRAGDGWLWYALGVMVLLFGGEERLRALAAAGASAGTGVGLFILLKRLSGRKRPNEIEPHCWATLLPPDRFSFPSGHTITAFAVAVSLGLAYPFSLGVLVIAAVAIGTSRILLGMHFLSDVAVGASLGTVLALTSHSLLFQGSHHLPF